MPELNQCDNTYKYIYRDLFVSNKQLQTASETVQENTHVVIEIFQTISPQLSSMPQFYFLDNHTMLCNIIKSEFFKFYTYPLKSCLSNVIMPQRQQVQMFEFSISCTIICDTELERPTRRTKDGLTLVLISNLDEWNEPNP